MAGGGSGGHISPIIAIISRLREDNPSIKIFFVGSKGGIEEKLIPQTGIRFLHIRCGKFSRYHKNMLINILDPTTIIKNVKGLVNFLLGISDSIKVLKKIKPDIVFLKGGFVSLPLGLACRLKGYPYLLHESDAVMGLANRILAKKAETVFVSFPEKNYPEVNPEKIIYSGNPIRPDVLTGEREEAKRILKLKEDLPTIMIIGGSQGAHLINELILDELEKFLQKFQLIHITGDYDYDYVEYRRKELSTNLKNRYYVYGFLTNNLKDAYAASDLVITRAGNNILTELAALGKPAVVIPLDSSANNHQRINATTFSREGAAYVLSQGKIKGGDLLRQAELIIENDEEREFLSKKIKQFYKPEATKVIAEKIKEIYQRRQEEEAREKKSKSQKD